MLIVSRRPGESLIVNGNIEIFLMEIQGGRAKIGINAPRDVGILRSELLEAEKHNIDAAYSNNVFAVAKLAKELKRSLGP